MNCDAPTLIAQAACLNCGIPSGMQDSVIISLLCQIANNSAAMNSATYPLTDGVTLNVNFSHGLSATPTYLRAVLLCTTNDVDSTIVAGQEVELFCFFSSATSSMPFGIGCDSTKIYLNIEGQAGAGIIVTWLGSNLQLSSLTNFSIKVYYK